MGVTSLTSNLEMESQNNESCFADLNDSENEEYEEDLQEAEVRGASDLSLANSTDKMVRVTASMQTVLQEQSPSMKAELGLNATVAGGGGNVKVNRGAVNYQFGEMLGTIDIFPHCRDT